MAFLKYIFFYVATAHTVPGSPHYWGFMITLRHSTLDRTPCGQVISPTQRHLLDNIQHSQETDIHSPGGIQTHNSTKQATANPRLRPRGHWDRLSNFCCYYFYCIMHLNCPLCFATSGNLQTKWGDGMWHAMRPKTLSWILDLTRTLFEVWRAWYRIWRGKWSCKGRQVVPRI